jgi:hypothetical protein
LNGEGWFRAFKERLERKSSSPLYKTTSDPKWTAGMYKILRGMAEDWGYTVEREPPAVFGGRFDMEWVSQSDNEMIFIEHENNPHGVMKSEIPKLLRIGANLTILITYLPPNWSRGVPVYPGETLAQEVLHLLRKKRPDPGFEFLMVFGTYTMYNSSNWVAWSFFPTFDYRPLIVPSKGK